MSEESASAENGSERPPGPLEYRTAKQLGVDFQQRIIELIVMPYDERATVEHRGRMITESVAPDAFKGIEKRRRDKIPVNRDHDVTRLVGKTIGLYPERDEGLVAELKIVDTPLGQETLALASEEILNASAGFLPMPGGEQWPSRNERRLTKLWLGHIAMVAEPAFEGAKVLSLRSSNASATPYRDALGAWLLSDEYARFSDSR
jgi:HK97 family phage prohead protease